MDSQTKVNVEFKPAKRMKKRRELDALVNGKQAPTASSFRGGSSNGHRTTTTTTMRNGKHELLRNDSDSSEVEEFILPEKSLVRKRGNSTLCSVCVTVCWGVLLVVCLVGIGGLVWVCIQLKKDVDQLRFQLDRVGILTSNIPGEVRDIHTEQEKMIERMIQLESGDLGMERLRENFTLLVKQVSELGTAAKTLSQSVANTPQLLALQSLPQQVKDLSTKVAELGSNLQTTGQSMQELQEAKEDAKQQLSDINARLQTLQLTTNEQKSAGHRDDERGHTMSTDDLARLDSLGQNIALMNVTFYTNLEDLRTKYNLQQASVLELYNYTNLLNTRVTFIEVRPTPQSLTENDVSAVVTASVQTMLEEMRNYSKDQDLSIQQNKAQSTSLMTLLQAQITGHESKISVLSDRLNKINISVTDLENMTDLNIESLNSKLQLLTNELKTAYPVEHSNVDKEEGEPSPFPRELSSTSSTSSHLSSSTALASLSLANEENQNQNITNNLGTDSDAGI